MFVIVKTSHLVGWVPYSKSVSIRDVGLETRNFPTGSMYVSSGAMLSAYSSTTTCNLSVADIPDVLKLRTTVVVGELSAAIVAVWLVDLSDGSEKL